MNKIIKLWGDHYIGVDDSEKPAIDDWVIDIKNPKLLRQIKTNHLLEDLYKTEKKITHSTQPIERDYSQATYGIQYVEIFNKIKPLSLSEVEEAIYGYSVEDRMIVAAQQYALDNCGDNMSALTKVKSAWENGFKAHGELVKDKLFTVEDMELLAAELIGRYRLGEIKEVEDVQKIINSRLTKTEWDVEIDEQGKIKLIN